MMQVSVEQRIEDIRGYAAADVREEGHGITIRAWQDDVRFLLRQYDERLRVNVGLVAENTSLKREIAELRRGQGAGPKDETGDDEIKGLRAESERAELLKAERDVALGQRDRLVKAALAFMDDDVMTDDQSYHRALQELWKAADLTGGGA